MLLRALLADQLREAGLTVVEAGHSDEALAYLNSGGQVDLVFSDIEMPGSMNGLELAREVRARHSTLPIILTSGKSWRGAQNVGLGAFIPKPYDVARAISIERLAISSPPTLPLAIASNGGTAWIINALSSSNPTCSCGIRSRNTCVSAATR